MPIGATLFFYMARIAWRNESLPACEFFESEASLEVEIKVRTRSSFDRRHIRHRCMSWHASQTRCSNLPARQRGAKRLATVVAAPALWIPKFAHKLY